MNNNTPFSPSADRNKDAILEVLRVELNSGEQVLEYGSGTGQHACHIAEALPDIRWQPSDKADKLSGMQTWISNARCLNILPPIELDLSHNDLPEPFASACFSANTLHIVSESFGKILFAHAAKLLSTNNKLLVYGPFRFNGKHISQGNVAFDKQLRHENSDSGIRDVIDLDRTAAHHNFLPARVVAMPANNHLLIWEKN